MFTHAITLASSAGLEKDHADTTEHNRQTSNSGIEQRITSDALIACVSFPCAYVLSLSFLSFWSLSSKNLAASILCRSKMGSRCVIFSLVRNNEN